MFLFDGFMQLYLWIAFALALLGIAAIIWRILRPRESFWDGMEFLPFNISLLCLNLSMLLWLRNSADFAVFTLHCLALLFLAIALLIQSTTPRMLYVKASLWMDWEDLRNRFDHAAFRMLEYNQQRH